MDHWFLWSLFIIFGIALLAYVPLLLFAVIFGAILGASSVSKD